MQRCILRHVSSRVDPRDVRCDLRKTYHSADDSEICNSEANLRIHRTAASLGLKNLEEGPRNF